MPKNHRFWVTAIGRSGTNKIASLLSEVSGTRVRHEDADGRTPAVALPWSQFPIHRFWGDAPVYGECHGMLRYHLTGDHPGYERTVPYRAIIYRDLRKVISAWMNRDNRTIDELSAVIYEVSWQWMNLELYANSDAKCQIFDFDALMTNVTYLGMFYCHLGFDGYEACAAHQEEVINATPEASKWFHWNDDTEALFAKINGRIWNPLGLSSNYVKMP